MNTEAESIRLLDLLLQGGWAMLPLGSLSLAMFYLGYYCWQQTRAGNFQTGGLSLPVRQALEQADWQQFENLWQQLNPMFRQACYGIPECIRDPGFLRLTTSERLDLLQQQTEHWSSRLGQWIHSLNVVASISPMVGLLGTVSGMIGAFQTIATGGMGKPELLAGDIGEALVTTATGLVIGIPAMILFFIMRNRLNNRVQEVNTELKRWLAALENGTLADSEPVQSASH